MATTADIDRDTLAERFSHTLDRSLAELAGANDQERSWMAHDVTIAMVSAATAAVMDLWTAKNTVPVTRSEYLELCRRVRRRDASLIQEVRGTTTIHLRRFTGTHLVLPALYGAHSLDLLVEPGTSVHTVHNPAERSVVTALDRNHLVGDDELMEVFMSHRYRHERIGHNEVWCSDGRLLAGECARLRIDPSMAAEM